MQIRVHWIHFYNTLPHSPDNVRTPRIEMPLSYAVAVFFFFFPLPGDRQPLADEITILYIENMHTCYVLLLAECSVRYMWRTTSSGCVNKWLHISYICSCGVPHMNECRRTLRWHFICNCTPIQPQSDS